MIRRIANMSKLLATTAMVAVLFVSCRKEENQHFLSFSASTPIPEEASTTKTVTGEGYTLADNTTMKVVGQTFKVYATYHQGSADLNVFSEQPQTVTYNTSLGGSTEAYYWRYYTNGTWEYWKPMSTYKFRAVYPGDKANLESGSTSSRVMLDYKTGVTGAPDNYDLTVAYTERTPVTEGYGAVPLTFNHALAAVSVKVRYNDAVSSTASDKLMALYFRNLIQSATLFFPSSDGSKTIDWSNNQGINYTDKLYSWSNTDGISFTNSTLASAFGGKYIFVIPQTIGSKQAAIYFQTQESGTIVNLGYLPAITWEPGKIYDYTLLISASSIEVVVTIKTWTKFESENDITIS